MTHHITLFLGGNNQLTKRINSKAIPISARHTQKTLQNNWSNQMAQIFKLLHNKTSLNYPSVSLKLIRNTCAVCLFQVVEFDVLVINATTPYVFETKFNEKRVYWQILSMSLRFQHQHFSQHRIK